jgi:hypothetical protein
MDSDIYDDIYDTETTCHCGADYKGSDHCWYCYHEQYQTNPADCEVEYMGDLPEYTVPEVIQFVEDMRQALLPVEHYHGRFWWEGPAVRVDDLHTAMQATRVPVQWDSMGMGYIVYPRIGDSGNA